MRKGFYEILEGILNSYAQIFFSKSKTFAVVLLLVSFFDYGLGLSGLCMILWVHFLARAIGYAREEIRQGTYGFNALLVGFFLGSQYLPNVAFIIVFLLAGLFVLLITVGINQFLLPHQLPFLSLPFTMTVWFLALSLRDAEALVPNVQSLYFMNRLYAWGGMWAVQQYEYLRDAPFMSLFWQSYLKSLSAILFQSNIIAGLLISIGLFMHSRIAFWLSLYGFAVGYGYLWLLQSPLERIEAYHLGFNFSLTAIALGGFFFITSWRSLWWVALAMPLVAMLMSISARILGVFQLPMLSLPFFLGVVSILLLLKNKAIHTWQAWTLKPSEVFYQHYAPEQNLYYYLNEKERFFNTHYFHFSLPFYGNWRIWQGYEGKYTHQGAYQYALDFVIMDNDDKTYRGEGSSVEDYYCYNLPVIAPAAGIVVALENNIKDNRIGEINLQHNWGNSIVIKHQEYLYSKISHIRADSCKVKVGDYVQKGQILANNGNSGRSPEPHIHFQIQYEPIIGATSISYPFAYYVKKLKTETQQKYSFHSFEIPKEEEDIENVALTPILQQAFGFYPTQQLHWKVELNGKDMGTRTWEVRVNMYNQIYLYCLKTQAQAYFINNGTLLYFTAFVGDKRSELYDFYLAHYKLLLGFYQNITLKDTFPIEYKNRLSLLRYFQDGIAPFYIFIKKEYQLKQTYIDAVRAPKNIIMNSTIKTYVMNIAIQEQLNTIHIENNRLQRVEIMKKKSKLVLQCEDFTAF